MELRWEPSVYFRPGNTGSVETGHKRAWESERLKAENMQMNSRLEKLETLFGAKAEK
jgi:hypothetical protein